MHYSYQHPSTCFGRLARSLVLSAMTLAWLVPGRTAAQPGSGVLREAPDDTRCLSQVRRVYERLRSGVGSSESSRTFYLRYAVQARLAEGALPSEGGR